MKEKLKFKLDVIPARFGGGYKAKMCARTTVGMSAASWSSPSPRAVAIPQSSAVRSR